MIVEIRNINLPCGRHELEEVLKLWFKARSLFTKAYKYIDAVIFEDLSESKYRVEMNGYENRYIIYPHLAEKTCYFSNRMKQL